jgi:valyl-tRNA synthetase
LYKSKGNVVWSHELLNKYNVDVVRYWIGTAKWGEDLCFNEKDLIAGKRFLTKLWNASRFAIMHLKDFDNKKVKLEVFDKWLLSKLNAVVKKATEYFDKYDSSESKKLVEQFFWHIFCDNYLEIIKDRLYNSNKRGKNSKKSAQYSLHKSLFTILKLIAPIVPHITEEIYQDYFIKKEKFKSIHLSDWPKYDKKLEDKRSEKIGDLAVEIISKVRKFKSKNNKSLKTEVNLILNKKHKTLLNPVLEDLKSTVKAKEIKFGDKFRVEFLE